MRYCWIAATVFVADRIFGRGLAVSRRDAVAGGPKGVCARPMVVATVSEVGSDWHTMSCDVRRLCDVFSENCLKPAAFMGNGITGSEAVSMKNISFARDAGRTSSRVACRRQDGFLHH